MPANDCMSMRNEKMLRRDHDCNWAEHYTEASAGKRDTGQFFQGSCGLGTEYIEDGLKIVLKSKFESVPPPHPPRRM